MTDPTEDLLTTTEGVDEGSAASTAEGGPTPTEEPTGVRDPQTRSLGDAGGRDQDAEAAPAPPVDMESDESRAARAARGTGQQLEAGEG